MTHRLLSTYMGSASRLAGIAALSLVFGVTEAHASAVITAVDLTAKDSSATVNAVVGGNFYVSQVDPQPTGSGVIHSFLRINSNDPTERAYNTDATGILDDAGNGDGFTRSLLLSAVPIVSCPSGTCYEFFLDINQNSGSGSKLSLNQLQIFQANGDPGAAYTLSGSPETLTTLTGANQVFRMSDLTTGGGATYDLQLDFDANKGGSGQGDYRFLIPTTLFNVNLSNVILYAQFGNPTGAYSETDGYEEFWVFEANGTPGPGNIEFVPEPASLLLLGTGMGLLARRVRRNRA